ncbi:hypothetical protein PF327_11285 [Sulfurovum sp. XTW-4]|uniref:Uncharacterized protein n=1 Tax=Sulfurovum xiamenensis TaxID=3019066 RepID=A0ABT7QUL7_9BACT|nr:hypothetical protein [Sulfurovum xiamenensis]MDM5264778.1 hypothetical protein [Sulfurovum xiamenensis]
MSNVKMITKKEALSLFGVAPTSEKRKDVFDILTEYENPYNSKAIYRLDEVESKVRELQKVADKVAS